MLNHLSIDAIVAITNELEGRDIARLWICGDALLNHRLGRGGGVKKFSQTFDSLFPGTWPSIVRYFASLEEFTVRHSWDEVPEGEWKPRYSDLSKSVVRVRLAHPDDIISFYEALLGGGTPHLRELTTMDTPNHDPLIFRTLVAHLPHIEVLRFRSFSVPLPLPWVWPKNLRQISITIDLPGEDSIVLPESLEVLKVSRLKRSLHSIQWPPNLLKLILSNTEEIPVEEALRLPRSLTVLRLTGVRFENSPEFWKALPPHLTKLQVSMRAGEQPMIELLPRTLKRFHDLPVINLENVKFLPPSLTVIQELNIALDPKVYELLPTGLRQLNFVGYVTAKQGDDLIWTRLPDTLEQVFGLNARYLDHYALPRCIRKFSLSVDELTDKRLDKLVSSKMRLLSLFNCKLDAQAVIRCLPQGLTSLTLGRCADLAMGDEACKLLPKTLTHLTAYPVTLTNPKALLHLPVGLKELHIHSKTFEVGFLGDGASLLPKLEALIVHIDKLTPGLAPYLFAILPRKLKHFQLAYPKEFPLDITDASLESLPRGLLTIETSSPSAQVSGSWYALKPPCFSSASFSTPRRPPWF